MLKCKTFNQQRKGKNCKAHIYDHYMYKNRFLCIFVEIKIIDYGREREYTSMAGLEEGIYR